MIPILYSTITEGTVPSHYGVGALSDCLTCQVTEERNGAYELYMEYPANGIHAEDIILNAFIKAQPNFTDVPQIFRIYKVGKNMNGKFTVQAQHIIYDLSGKVITSGTANSCYNACKLLEAQAGNFTITTNKTLSGTFKITEPSSVRSWFGGKAGSILDIFGPGEWEYDNYTARFKAARGADRGVTIRYGKNLTELSQELNLENLCTGVVPYYIDQDGNVTTGTKVATGLVLDVPKDVAIDFTQDVDPESGTAITTQLANLANRYINNNVLTVPINSITLDFVQLSDFTERVDLCDTVHIYFEALNLTATTKCVKTVWDVLQERYIKTTFGTLRTNLADTFVAVQQTVNSAANRTYMAEAIAHATELITGNLGGYVVLHDSDGNGQPDEILVMDTADITTATQVWRWNKNGLGYSGSGYAGPFSTLALTADGKIVADAITTGTLNADLIKAGTISDLNNKFQINLADGSTILDQLRSKTSIAVTTEGLAPRVLMSYTVNDGSTVRCKDSNGTTTADMESTPSGYGLVAVGNNAGTQLGTFFANANGGHVTLDATDSGYSSIYLRGFNSSHELYTQVSLYTGATGGHVVIGDSDHPSAVTIRSVSDGGIVEVNNGTRRVGYLGITTGGSESGSLLLTNSSGTAQITCSGDTGNITCVSLTQTSSREVKKNIKPLKDARKILELEAVQFDYKEAAQGKNKRGFIAEDVAEVLPNLVTEATEERPATLDYMQMIPYLQAVIKEQDERIKALEEKISQIGG